MDHLYGTFVCKDRFKLKRSVMAICHQHEVTHFTICPLFASFILSVLFTLSLLNKRLIHQCTVCTVLKSTHEIPSGIRSVLWRTIPRHVYKH